MGFIFCALLMWGMESAFGRGPVVRILSMLLGLLVCYATGTLWFMYIYSRDQGSIGLLTVLGWCVFPFILPDLLKIALAFALAPRIRRLRMNR